MAAPDDVLNAARSKLGVAESPPGSNQVEFASWAGIPGQPWCAAFVSWCLDQGGALDVARFVYCPTGVAEYKAAGRWDGTPSPGAVVFFQWPGGDRPAHVGLVEAVRGDGSIVSLEGNTDERGGATGGKVMRQVRRANIVGYGHPAYADAPAAPAPAPAPAPAGGRPMLRKGSTGGYVRLVQARLRIPADGIFGPQTDGAVRAFQQANKLVVDGIVGPNTWAALG